jgi:hypothetical protein
MEAYMSEPEKKWNVERMHSEIYDARTKLFVICKVLETGTVDLSEHPEWVLVIKPIIADLMANATKIQAFLKDEDIVPPEA